MGDLSGFFTRCALLPLWIPEPGPPARDFLGGTARGREGYGGDDDLGGGCGGLRRRKRRPISSAPAALCSPYRRLCGYVGGRKSASLSGLLAQRKGLTRRPFSM